MKKVLVFGGTRFFGKELVKDLLLIGDDVTIFTRGNVYDEFNDSVKRLKGDKNSIDDLKNALEGKEYDVVYDTISYSPSDAKRVIEVLKGKTKKYIVISSAAVYDKGENLNERDFNPLKYDIKLGEREEFSYKEGKRLMESYLFKNAPFKVMAVRFPVVIGKDDYTNRLKTYVENVCDGVEIGTTNIKQKMNIISQGEAGVFLTWLRDLDITGAINATCTGDVSLEEILDIIYDETSKDYKISKEENNKTSPYNDYLGLTISNLNIKELGGYFFKNAKGELVENIKRYAKEIK